MHSNERFLKKWERTRQYGKLKYVCIKAALLIAVALTGAILGKLARGIRYNLPMDGLVETVITNMIGGLVVGVIGSFISWHNNEKRYKEVIKYENKKDNV